jgi:HEAT repeat protein
MRVRESGVEVELAAYGLAKNSASVEYLLKTADSPNHAQKIWALWALGLMANRGVETEQVVNVLTSHLKDSDADSRRWAVEALALTANDQAIEPLLTTMHDDASPLVRERAACSLAVSGLFTPQQRFTAVPQLLNYSDDAALDARTHGWAFQALGDITHQRLPNDSGAWRNWYNSSRND